MASSVASISSTFAIAPSLISLRWVARALLTLRVILFSPAAGRPLPAPGWATALRYPRLSFRSFTTLARDLFFPPLPLFFLRPLSTRLVPKARVLSCLLVSMAATTHGSELQQQQVDDDKKKKEEEYYAAWPRTRDGSKAPDTPTVVIFKISPRKINK